MPSGVKGSIIMKRITKKVVPKKKYKVRRVIDKQRRKFPLEFPFWARMKIAKKRTTLVIDDEPVFNKTSKRFSNLFIHREATHSYKKGREVITPNPDSSDSRPMYLRTPTKMNQRMFIPHNKRLSMPSYLKQKYKKNNRK